MDNFETALAKLMPQWEAKGREVIFKDLPSRSNVHVNKPLGEEEPAAPKPPPSKPKADENPPLNNLEATVEKSLSPELARAKAADLVDLPDSVDGTNCGNCRFIDGDGERCDNPKVNQAVTDRMCCALWDAEGTKRAWLEKSNTGGELGDELGTGIFKDGGRRVATVAVHHGDHMLMGKRRDNGKWTVPGGHVDQGETMLEGAKRELQEETGIGDAEHMEELTGLHKTTDLKGKQLHVQAYRVKFADRPSTSMLKDPDGEIQRWQWVNVKNGLPEHIAGNLHVPKERNILMSALGFAPKMEVNKDAMDGFHDMQDIVNGMDYEMAFGVIDPDLAKDLAVDHLKEDPDYYKTDGEESGIKLDLGSGGVREHGHLGIDTYPHDHGTIVHDLSTGIPFPSGSISKVRAVNSLHEVHKDPKPLLSEIERVLMPGGEFHYEGPSELTDYPEWLVQTDFDSNEEAVEKVDGEPTFRQTFRRVADPATSNDAWPSVNELPTDAILAINALGYGNDQDILNKNDDSKPWYEELPVFKAIMKLLRKKPVDNTTADSAIAAKQSRFGGNSARNSSSAAAFRNESQKYGKAAEKIRSDLSKRSGIDPVKKSGLTVVRKETKDEDVKNPKLVPIFKADMEKQLVYGVVLSPDEVDSQEDWMQADDIEKAAHYYLKNSRVVGSGHSKPISAEVVESYIAPQDFETVAGQYGPQKVKQGSWVLGVKINDKNEWSKVKDGDYTGFSVGGFGLRDRSTSANL